MAMAEPAPEPRSEEPEPQREAEPEADAAKSDGEADVGDGAIGIPEQGGRPLEAARQEVLVRRLAERAAELTAEVRAREVSGPGERGDVERLAIAGVREVLRAQEVADGVRRVQGAQYRRVRRPVRRPGGPSPRR